MTVQSRNDDDPLIYQLLNAEKMLFGTVMDDPYLIGQSVHNFVSLAMTCDSFYLCLWDEKGGKLSFLYNYDSAAGRSNDSPCITLLGAGPTSHVIRTGRSFMVNELHSEVQHAGINFGDIERQSASAMHVPMSAESLDGDKKLLGVLSAQSYASNAYSQADLRLLEWIGLRTGELLMKCWYKEQCAAARTNAGLLEADRSQHAQKLVNSFIDLHTDIDRAILDVAQIIPQDNDALRTAVRRLGDISQRVQAKVTYLHLLPTARTGDIKSSSPLIGSLSDRERDVLPLLALGKSMKEIARVLSISVSTVKYHQANILLKLGLESRGQLSQYLSARPSH